MGRDTARHPCFGASLAHRGRRGGDGRGTRRSERGLAIVELSLVIPVIAALVFTSVDLGRTAQYQNRMLNAAREGAAIASLFPTKVDSGCDGDRNVVDRTREQNPELAEADGYSVTVAKKHPVTGALTPYTGCGTASDGVAIAPGDRIVVTVTVDVDMSGPITSVALGSELRLSRSLEVVVQG